MVLALVLSIWFRLPALVNAGAVNSDAAIVGLQTRHMLHGEWSPTIWAAQYQLPIESVLLLPFTALFGSHPFWLYLIPALGMVVMIALVWKTLRRELSPLATFACVLPIVFATHSINSPMVYVMRQVMVTTVILGVALWSRANAKGLHWYFLGGFFVAGGVVIDMFGLILVPAGMMLLVLCSRDRAPGQMLAPSIWRTLARLGCGALGLAASIKIAAMLGHLPPFLTGTQLPAINFAPPPAVPVHHGFWPKIPEAFLREIQPRLDLFWDHCMPFALGIKGYEGGIIIPSPEWYPPGLLRKEALFGAILLVFMMTLSIPLLFVRRIPWELRRLGIFGLGCGVTAATAFIVMPGAVDIWSTRYLAPIMWFAPFALAPAFHLLKPRKAFVASVLVMIGPLLCGWATYGDYVQGARIVQVDRARGDEEKRLAIALRARGITIGFADYWLSYRLGLLLKENPPVIPFSPSQDRYPPYRALADKAPVRAYIFHPTELRSMPEQYRPQLVAGKRLIEEFHVGGFTVFLERNPSLVR